ncbi:related to aspergillopepsin II precursor [Ramularia collo-cygni]|uniref:Related to aspergillopepsin II n=1 Tax=Ramularia collo-cygni TaxID=112498 RepID=A0A2D3V4J6_9PEZI|nr:related to aspergillopepsin II precursor [Ramularia collo-cygni]CZT15213.1 related to aspergillopepsin II precursor [Ramularia collo-cygni]
MKSHAQSTFLLLATITSLTTAAPRTDPQQKQCDGRRISPLRNSQHRTTGPLRANSTGLDSRISFGKSSEVQYSSNWAGAVQISEEITEVSGQVTFPRVAAPKGASPDQGYGGSVWVGIDGDTCSQSILQTGVDWVVQGNTATYAAWYEWLPEASYDFDIVVNPGDQIEMKVVADSATGGTATISNFSTNETVSHTFSGKSALCKQNAEWIVEDFSISDGQGNMGLVPFAAFDTIVVTNATYKANGETAGVSGSTIMDISQGGQPLTNCATSGDNNVVCKYKGAGSETRFM